MALLNERYNVSLREPRADNNEPIKIRYGVLILNVLGQKYYNYLSWSCGDHLGFLRC